MTDERYRDVIMQPVEVPFGLESVGPGFMYQDDNARPHSSRVVHEFHDHHQEYTDMSWPASSPDLNIMEHAWDRKARAVDKQAMAPTCIEDLHARELQTKWALIPQMEIQKLYRSMNKKGHAVDAF